MLLLQKAILSVNNTGLLLQESISHITEGVLLPQESITYINTNMHPYLNLWVKELRAKADELISDVIDDLRYFLRKKDEPS